MHRNIFLYSPAGQTIPQGVIDAVTGTYKSWLSGATAANGAIEDYAVIEKDLNLDEFRQTVEHMKDADVVFALGDYPQGFSHEDVQPFALIRNAEGEPILSAYLDGDFSNHAHPPQNHSPHYICAQSFLLPLVNDLYKDVEEDPDKLLIELKSKMFERQMKSLGIGDKNVVLLLHGSGELLDFSGAGHQKVPFEGGWSSAPIPAAATKKVPPEPAPKLNRFGKPIRTSVPETGSQSRALLTSGEAASPTTKTIQELNNSTAASTPKTAPGPKPVMAKWGKWPASRADKNAIKNWIAKYAHDPVAKYDFRARPLMRLRDDFDPTQMHPKTGRPLVEDYEERPITGLAALEHLTQQAPPAEEPKKATEPAPAPKPEVTPPAEAEPEFAPTQPMIPVPDKDKVLEAYTDAENLMRKVIDTHAKTVVDPEEEKKKFAKFPDFAQELGMDWEEIMTWEWDVYKLLGQISMPALAKLAFSLRHQLVQELAKNSKKQQPTQAAQEEVKLNKFGKPIKKVA